MRLFHNLNSGVTHVKDSNYTDFALCGIWFKEFISSSYEELDKHTSIDSVKLCKTCKKILESNHQNDFFIGEYVLIEGRGPNVHQISAVKPYYLRLDDEIDELKRNCVKIPNVFKNQIKTTVIKTIDFDTYNKVMRASRPKS